ncbi:SLAM family member 9-like isoform X2 [Cervus canadensis]|uniref:SLAM family member 9-like isoform X2 n=1 Tax=Cervus canadensis TaxID=1574408 RepID=UPI001C9E1F19|nr:SLAM family member 9-like isoform X2 [Cervus canadensis]
MGIFLLWSLLLLGLLTGPGASRAPMVVTGTLGGSVTLPLQLQDGQQVESISWVCRSVPGAIATVTLVEAGGPDTFHQAESRYWGRLSVVGPERSLQISHLSWADAGSYRAHINLQSSRVTHTREYSLHVYEQLAQPRVTVSTRISGNGYCLIILTCVAESRGGAVTYSWTPLGPQTAVSHGGSVLSVTLRPGDSALNFTCMVKNPVSNSSSLPILVQPSCTGPGILGGKESVGETVIGTLGKSATLPLEVPVGQEISSLRLQDSGPYQAWITLHSPPINITKDFILHVYERLQEPKITASSQIMKDGTCFITLICSLDQPGEDVQYSWDPRGHGAVVSHGGTTLSVSWRSGVSDSYHCTVKNPISQSSSSIPVRPLCSGSFLPCCLRKEFLLFLILGALQIK